MNEYFRSVILRSTGASALVIKETIQDLWSGYGKIMRIGLENAAVASVIVKHVQLPTRRNHPRGWNTDIGHQRKVKSYQVESNGYNTYHKNSAARLPQCLAVERKNDEVLMVLEDQILDTYFEYLQKELGTSNEALETEWRSLYRVAWADFHRFLKGWSPGHWKLNSYSERITSEVINLL